jgi:16S rRNA G966 N2-methylase RsmD
VIQKNLDKLRLTGARIVRSDASRALAAEATAGAKYDLVLVDPPYDSYERIQLMLARYLPTLLAADGLVLVETSDRVQPELPLELLKSRKYGSARISVFGG